jgi:3-oxocholest-4-en-26-oyl-CoA dehydrogenase beta subunit
MNLNFPQIAYDNTEIRVPFRELVSDLSASSTLREVESGAVSHDVGLWAELQRGGWLGICLPEKLGGSGQPVSDFQLVTYELGRAGAAVPWCSSVAGSAIFAALALGASEARDELALKIIDGQVWCAAVTEQAWLPHSLGTVIHGGRIRGKKSFVGDASYCNGLLVAAQDGDDIVWGLVDIAAPGVGISPMPNTSGVDQYAIQLDAPFRAIDRTGPGALAAWGALRRFSDSVWAIGLMSRVLEMTVDHAIERHQFGRSIGSFQAVQHILADVAIGLQMCMHLARTAAFSIDDHGLADRRSLAATCELAEATRRYGRLAVRQAHQIFGGLGYSIEHDLNLFTRRLKSMTLLGEDSTTLRQMIISLRYGY